LFIDRKARLHKAVRNCIGLDKMRAEFDKHFTDGGLATRNTAGETDLHQFAPLTR
jgi:hypothetical protein